MSSHDPFARVQALSMQQQYASWEFKQRWQKVNGRGQFDAILPHPERGLILVGGPRNPKGALPASTRMGLLAAFKGVERATNRLNEAYTEAGVR